MTAHSTRVPAHASPISHVSHSADDGDLTYATALGTPQQALQTRPPSQNYWMGRLLLHFYVIFGMHSRLCARTLADIFLEHTSRRWLTCADVVCQLSHALGHCLSQVDHEPHSLHQRREEQLRLGIEFVLCAPAAEKASVSAMSASSSCSVSCGVG